MKVTNKLVERNVPAARRAVDELSAESHVALGTKAHALRRTVRGLLEKAGGNPDAIDTELKRELAEKAAREAVASLKNDQPGAMDEWLDGKKRHVSLDQWLGTENRGVSLDQWLGTENRGVALDQWLGVQGTPLAAWLAADSAEELEAGETAEEEDELDDEQAVQLVDMFDKIETVLAYAAQSGDFIRQISDGLIAIYTWLSKLIKKYRLMDYGPKN
ncbi:protein of unknown function [Burkholderia multivorans]